MEGTCNVNTGIDDDEVTIGVDVEDPGGPGGPGGGGADEPEDPCVAIDACRDDYDATPPVTLSDIAHFRPTPGVDVMQPDGWMVVGLHTNFYAVSNVHVKSGELLGEPASVRFTPIGYRWWYGDGATRYSATAGSTWKSLGVAEFDRTPTSHIYRNPGTYFIDLSIVFRAEYRFVGEAWYPIQGTLTVPANRLVAVAGGAKTVLVEDDCTINPSGPGC